MDWYILPCISMAFILLDIVTGVLQAVANKCLDSKKLRQGLWHKSGFVMAICLAYLCEYAMGYVDLGFSVPLVGPVCGYLCLTELVSIVENICKISPELCNSKFMGLFGQSGGDDGQGS